MVCLFMVVTISTGCGGFQRLIPSSAQAAPEQVYLSSSFHPYPNADILICKFQAPDYAKGVGEKAALFLYTQMQPYGLEANIAVAADIDVVSSHQLYLYARKNRHDLIVTGKVLYYLDGAISTASKVVEEMYIYGIWGGKLQPVGYVKVEETAAPLPAADYIFFQRSVEPAPSAESLQKRNAAKFARILSSMFSEDE